MVSCRKIVDQSGKTYICLTSFPEGGEHDIETVSFDIKLTDGLKAWEASNIARPEAKQNTVWMAKVKEALTDERSDFKFFLNENPESGSVDVCSILLFFKYHHRSSNFKSF